jgi:5-methyltetrahydropteroyltriglutamate--homocysteine methyltransferase
MAGAELSVRHDDEVRAAPAAACRHESPGEKRERQGEAAPHVELIPGTKLLITSPAMADLQAFAPGIYPRSEPLVQATRDLDRGRTSQEAVDEQVELDLAELVSVQQEAGLDLLTDGMLRWQDHFRPLLEAVDGLETGALTRFLDTNTFYRAPSGTSESPTLRAPLDERYVSPLPGPRLVTLPSPFALAHGTGLSPKTVAEGVLRPALDGLDAELAVLTEPFLAREEKHDLSGLAEALEALSGGPKLALWLTFGDAGTVLAEAAELPVDGIGIDFYATHIEDVPSGFDKLLLAGVVDARNSMPEEPRELAAFAERLRERGVERIALVPNGDLQYVSDPIAREKLARLGKAKTATTEAAA